MSDLENLSLSSEYLKIATDLLKRDTDAKILFPEYEKPQEKQMSTEDIYSLISNTMTYKGPIGDFESYGMLHSVPNFGYKEGDTYTISSTMNVAGINCVSGDMAVCIKKFSGVSRNSDWAILKCEREFITRPALNPLDMDDTVKTRREVVIGVDTNPFTGGFIVENNVPRALTTEYKRGVRRPLTGMDFDDAIEKPILSTLKMCFEGDIESRPVPSDNKYFRAAPTATRTGPMIIGSPEQVYISNKAIKDNPKEDPVIAALRALAAEPSTDPYIAEEVSKDIQEEELDVESLRKRLL